MGIYLVACHLDRPPQRQRALVVAIESLAPALWHYLDSIWLIEHRGPASILLSVLSAHLDEGEQLLVVGLTAEMAHAGFDEEASRWLVDHIP